LGTFVLIAESVRAARHAMKVRTLKHLMLGLIVLLVIALAVFVASPANYFRLLGLLRREATFDGRPTSYWLAALKKDPFLGANPPKDVGKILREGGAPAVPVLLEMLHEGDAQTRSEVLLTLGLMKPDPATVRLALARALQTEDVTPCFDGEAYLLEHLDREAAVAALIVVLHHHPVATRRIRAAQLLAKLSGPDVAVGLRGAFTDSEASVRVEAAYALWQCDPQAPDAISFLAAMLGTVDEKARGEAVNTLSMIGRAAKEAVRPAALEALRDANSERRKDAVQVLAFLPRDQASVPALLAPFNDPVAEVRSRAAVALGGEYGKPFTAEDHEIVAALAKAMRDPDHEVRRRATWALARPGPSAPHAVPALVAMLQSDEEARNRSLAAQELRGLGSQAGPAIPALIVAAEHDPSEEVQSQALDTLVMLGPKACSAAIPILIEALHSPSRVHRTALSNLAHIGPQAAAAVPALLELLAARTEERQEVMGTLGAIGPGAQAAVPLLTAALDRKERIPIRWTAAAALWKIEHRSARIIPVLLQMLHDSKADTTDPYQAIRVLYQMGPKAEAAVPDLAKLIQGDERNMRDAAIATVGEIGPGAQAAIPALTAALDKKEFPSIRCAAASALWKITGEPTQVVPVLVEIALDLDIAAPERRQSAEILRGIGPKAKAAVPALVAALQDSNPARRDPATSLLAAIDPETAARLAPQRPVVGPENPARPALRIRRPAR
jgi:HEAT repeat protein